jgi:hypothetical protein
LLKNAFVMALLLDGDMQVRLFVLGGGANMEPDHRDKIEWVSAIKKALMVKTQSE